MDSVQHRARAATVLIADSGPPVRTGRRRGKLRELDETVRIAEAAGLIDLGPCVHPRLRAEMVVARVEMAEGTILKRRRIVTRDELLDDRR